MSTVYHNDDRRAVVTGIGMVAANGIGADAFWKTLIEGRSGVGPITLFDASQLPIRIAAEVKGFDPAIHMPAGIKWKRIPRQAHLGLAALDMALSDAGLSPGGMTSSLRRVHVFIGVSTSAIEVVEGAAHNVYKRQPNHVRPWVVWATQPHCVATTLAEYIGTHVAYQTVAAACKAGADAILDAVEAIRAGRTDIAIAGGTDASICASTCSAFCTSKMLSSRNEDPQRASRPFDRDRDGGVLGEGAAVLVIESLAHARARGARMWLELCGGASYADPFGMPAAEGLGACMSLALANARLDAGAIDYVCAHGPSDVVIDRMETAMIRRALGSRAYRIPVSSIKGVTGNPLASAGPLEIVACALAMRHDRVPPTANYTTPDPACDLDYVPESRRMQIVHALVNVHGMGGGNTTLVVRRPPP
jgi:3-oxoacyl-[acyl-carrier-protein] synthase II